MREFDRVRDLRTSANVFAVAATIDTQKCEHEHSPQE
jgi:hypothetical protein